MADQLTELFEYVRRQAIQAIQEAADDGPGVADALFAAYIDDVYHRDILVAALTVFAMRAARDELAREPASAD